MKQLLTFVVLLLATYNLSGQSDSLRNYDFVYRDNIHAVKFHINGLPLSNPIIDLNSSSRLVLSFDDLNDDITDYVYQIVHCDMNWKPSELDELDYIDGFNGERIADYNFSYNTLKDYTHYDLFLPNQDLRWTISGNYLLHIWEDNEERRPVITRRFMVAESKVRIGGELVAPSKVDKYRSHQEIDFLVNHKGLDIRNPRREITAVVLQNGRWDNAISGLKPVFIKGEDLLFDFQDKIVFPAGKEFRFLDMRTFRYLTEKMADMVERDTEYDIALFKEEARTFKNFRSYEDINGRFLIDHQEREDADIEGDYATIFFSVGVTQELFDTDVYLFGALTDWQIQDKYQLKYNPAVGAYVGKVLLKQGFYNYFYVGVPAGSDQIDYETFEGNWHETENEYTILIYYRPFGQRYDSLIAVRTLTANR